MMYVYIYNAIKTFSVEMYDDFISSFYAVDDILVL